MHYLTPSKNFGACGGAKFKGIKTRISKQFPALRASHISAPRGRQIKIMVFSESAGHALSIGVDPDELFVQGEKLWGENVRRIS